MRKKLAILIVISSILVVISSILAVIRGSSLLFLIGKACFFIAIFLRRDGVQEQIRLFESFFDAFYAKKWVAGCILVRKTSISAGNSANWHFLYWFYPPMALKKPNFQTFEYEILFKVWFYMKNMGLGDHFGSKNIDF
jgi:hypothetical protein